MFSSASEPILARRGEDDHPELDVDEEMKPDPDSKPLSVVDPGAEPAQMVAPLSPKRLWKPRTETAPITWMAEEDLIQPRKRNSIADDDAPNCWFCGIGSCYTEEGEAVADEGDYWTFSSLLSGATTQARR